MTQKMAGLLASWLVVCATATAEEPMPTASAGHEFILQAQTSGAHDKSSCNSCPSGTCATTCRKHGSCWDKMKLFFSYSSRSCSSCSNCERCKECVPCCTPPLYAYFLHRCCTDTWRPRSVHKTWDGKWPPAHASKTDAEMVQPMPLAR